jgi:dihydroxyacetone kinase-like protein
MSVPSPPQAPVDLVGLAIQSLVQAHPDIVALDSEERVVVRARPPSNDKVSVISGGGSGHEPLHSGFVGVGMLDAAVPGAIFASPTSGQVLRAITATHRGKGAMLVVKNYTGDLLNFGMAAELAADEGIQVETVVVDDDLATAWRSEVEDLQDSSKIHRPGRRGTAAVLAVEKICGAAAEDGAALKAIAALGRRVVTNAATLSLALTPCTNPETGRAAFDLEPGQLEFGVGIHGERGVEARPTAAVRELVAQLTTPILQDLSIGSGDAVLAIVNGLGVMTPLELAHVQAELSSLLRAKNVRIARVITGNFVTSLDMHGYSITLVRAEEEFLTLWDERVVTSTFKW